MSCESHHRSGERSPKCNQKYRLVRGDKQKLNVSAPRCLKEDKTLRELYDQLYVRILFNYIEEKLAVVEASPEGDPRSVRLYNDFVSMIARVFPVTFGQSSPRVLISETDGNVIVDSSKPRSVNTYENWKNKTIGENHNTRVSIMYAQLNENGVGYETKISTTTGTFQKYVAIRLGRYLDNTGTIRWSVDV